MKSESTINAAILGVSIIAGSVILSVTLSKGLEELSSSVRASCPNVPNTLTLKTDRSLGVTLSGHSSRPLNVQPSLNPGGKPILIEQKSP